MRLFSEFLGEDAGEKFRAMSDSQFDGWKKANPGAAAKADQLRSGKRDVKPGKPSSVQSRTKANYTNDPLKDARDKAIDKGSAIVKAKQDQRKQHQQQKSALAKQQAQDKQAEAKKDREEKQELRKDQAERKQELNKKIQDEKREKGGPLAKREPGSALVKNMQAKKKKPGIGLGKKVGTAAKGTLGVAKGIAKKGLGLAKSALSKDRNAAVGIGSAPGDQRGLSQRYSGF